jgi:hypothetical protein
MIGSLQAPMSHRADTQNVMATFDSSLGMRSAQARTLEKISDDELVERTERLPRHREGVVTLRQATRAGSARDGGRTSPSTQLPSVAPDLDVRPRQQCS